ncbi:MAG: hypothetical protein Q8N63_01790 [Nanoarchaeota archaeon]|nr:hypothetical protein [Nanoarchaeota archaeon]
MDDKYKWLRQYALPCFTKKRDSLEKLPNINHIEEFLAGDYSREKVRDYFFIPHNIRAIKERNYIHLLIPYVVEDIGDRGLTCTVNEPFYEELPVPFCSRFFDNEEIEQLKEDGILDKLRKNDILLVHFRGIVDSCTKKELKKYNYLYATQKILK